MLLNLMLCAASMISASGSEVPLENNSSINVQLLPKGFTYAVHPGTNSIKETSSSTVPLLLGASDFMVKIYSDGRYVVTQDGVVWLRSGDTFFHLRGKKYSTSAGTLILTGIGAVKKGHDQMGAFNFVELHWRAEETPLIGRIRVYSADRVAIFTQIYPEGATQTNTSNKDAVTSAFPTLIPEATVKGFLSYGEQMIGWETLSAGRWPDDRTKINFGEVGGPLVLAGENGSSSIVLSPFSRMLTTNLYYEEPYEFQLGIMGTIEQIPRGYCMETMLCGGNNGIGKTITSWGDFLTQYYRKKQRDDFTANYLGFYTDNGAYYYYRPNAGQTYEETLYTVVKELRKKMIPVRYLQLDSWWYYQGPESGVKNWTAMPTVFPRGIRGLQKLTGLPFVAHNRYWDATTDYAKLNGGNYDFIVEDKLALPQSLEFWEHLFSEARLWGLVTYEQDWMNIQTEHMNATHKNLMVLENWLNTMDMAASSLGINIQLCMALPRHALHSVTLNSVTQARVSGDYVNAQKQWKIGVTSLLAHALKISAFKDTYRSAANGTSNYTDSNSMGYDRKNVTRQDYTDKMFLKPLPPTDPMLHSLVSSLSAGPIGPGDKVEDINRNLIMKCCNEDGLILKPDKPATATDIQLLGMMDLDGGLPGQLWSTHTTFDTNTPKLQFGILFAAETFRQTNIPMNHVGLDYLTLQPYAIFSHKNTTEPEHVVEREAFSFISPPLYKQQFQLWYVSPIVQLSDIETIVLIGETSKWIPVSKGRIRRIELLEGSDLKLELTGRVGEKVVMGFGRWRLQRYSYKSVSCEIPLSGKMTMSYTTSTCTY